MLYICQPLCPTSNKVSSFMKPKCSHCSGNPLLGLSHCNKKLLGSGAVSARPSINATVTSVTLLADLDDVPSLSQVVSAQHLGPALGPQPSALCLLIFCAMSSPGSADGGPPGHAGQCPPGTAERQEAVALRCSVVGGPGEGMANRDPCPRPAVPMASGVQLSPLTL